MMHSIPQIQELPGMVRNPKQPSVDHIQRSCRSIKRGWSADERKRREIAAAVRQRQLVEFLCGSLRGGEA
jgi:hypothetical protein